MCLWSGTEKKTNENENYGEQQEVHTRKTKFFFLNVLTCICDPYEKVECWSTD